MIGGIILQLVFMCVFVALWVYVVFRARKAPSWLSLRPVILSISLASALIVTRNFYRAIELSQGWTGYLMTHEVFFCVLDGALMATCSITLSLIHPAFHLPKNPEDVHRRENTEYMSEESRKPIGKA